MTLRTIRIALGASLAVLAAFMVVWFHRQNAGLQPGGPISVPKALWLGYAIGAWAFLPFFLWRDSSLAPSVRRVFGIFLAIFATRGVLELILIFGFRHWTPVYGISEDLLRIAALVWFRRAAIAETPRDRRALRFTTHLAVSLVAEAVFAGMFLQTGAAARGIYFASSEPSWWFINTATTIALAFVLPDLAAALAGLWFHGSSSDTPRPLRIGRASAATLVAATLLSALGLWTWMMRAEASAARHQRVGYEIVASCAKFKDAFTKGDEAAMADFVTSGDASWKRVEVKQDHPFLLQRWEPGGAPGFLRALKEWRHELPEVLQAYFKIHLVDRIVSDEEAVLQLRAEVTSPLRTDNALWRCRFVKGADARWRVVEAALMEGSTASGGGNLFTDRAAERGLDFVMEGDKRFEPCQRCTEHDCPGPTKLKFQTMRHAYAGLAAADVDGDGKDDLFFCSGGRAAFYRNTGDGRFENATEKAGLAGLWHVNTAAFADADNDGDEDLYVASYFGPNHFFENRGDGTFADRTATCGILDDDLSTSLCWFDYDRDGDLDLYIGRFLDARTDIPDSFLYARNGQPNHLFRNDGGLRFTDVTEKAGVGERGLTLALAAADYDGDGDQDLYVANDFGRNVLYQNQGDGTFRDVAKETGTLAIGGSMSASWGDYDNDGRLDLYVAAIRSNQRWFVQPVTAQRVVLKFIREGKYGKDNPVFSDVRQYMGDDWMNIGNYALAGNSLLRQGPGGKFTDEAEAAGARPAGWYWGAGFSDIDNDGDLDIHAVDGWISGKNTYDL